VAEAYRTANDLFGDIIKVTPSSKVVGDMAWILGKKTVAEMYGVDLGVLGTRSTSSIER